MEEVPIRRMTEGPADILKIYLNEEVTVGIKSGEVFNGKLTGFDEHNNVLILCESTCKFIRGEIILFIGQV